jgi:uncharacterized cupin superfamily protein
MTHEADLERTDHGLKTGRPGWFILNARDAQWRRRAMGGHSLPLTGWEDEDCDTHFARIGMNLFRMGRGEPIGLYHWENDAEEFLVLQGEATLIIEGQERPLKQWDFVHCPPGTRHMIVGAGSGCLLVAVGAREHMDEDCNGGGYVADETARRYGASVDQDMSDASAEYARLGTTTAVAYQDGWLPHE